MYTQGDILANANAAERKLAECVRSLIWMIDLETNKTRQLFLARSEAVEILASQGWDINKDWDD